MLRIRLLLPSGDHQFANVNLAGVRCARTASRQGEAAEPWADEVGCVIQRFLASRIDVFSFSGQDLH